MNIKKFFKSNKNLTFLSAILFGLLIHIFGLVNTVHNYDDIAMLPFGFGSSITSGRWFLGVLGGIYHILFGSYNLPFINGFILILFIAFSARCLTTIFDIKSKVISILIGAIFVCFPSTTSILFFKYTAPYYGLAVFLSVYAAKLLIESDKKLLLSALFTALSLGIYQAYLPITVGILIIYLIKICLEDNNITFKKVFKKGIYYCVGIIVGLLMYKIILDLIILICNTFINKFSDIISSYAGTNINNFSLSDYQGISEMGKISLKELPAILFNAYKSFVFLPINDYCSLAQTFVIKIVYIIIYFGNLIIIASKLYKNKAKIGVISIVALLCLLYPLGINLIVVMCPNSYIYTLMVHSFVLVPMTPLIFLETYPFELETNKTIFIKFKKVICSSLIILVFCYSILTNLNYSYMYYNTEQAKNYVVSLVAQVRMTNGFDTNKKWVFIGDIDDPLLKSNWNNVPIYGGNKTPQEILNMYSRENWISNYVGYSIPWANNKADEIKKTNEFQNMPCWPNEGSIKIIDEYVVVKFEK